MRKKLVAIVLAAAALSAAPLAAPPAHADETPICAVFADPYDRPCWLVLSLICRQPFPPFTICR